MFRFYKRFVIILAVVLCLLSIRYFDLSFPKKVIDVIDGDTIQLSGGEMIRYIGINTPEVRERSGKEWIYDPSPFSLEAKEYNKSLVKNKFVKIKTDTQKRDKFGRILAYVYTLDKNLSKFEKFKVFLGIYNHKINNMVNLNILREGLSIVDIRLPNTKFLDVFVETQKISRNNRNGLWKTNLSAIAPGKTKFHIGEIMTVEGIVSGIKDKGKVVLIEFKEDFSAVIFNSNLSFFRDNNISISNLVNERIEIYGMIKKYRGDPQIIISHPCQVKSY